jgi:hypothetical protein
MAGLARVRSLRRIILQSCGQLGGKHYGSVGLHIGCGDYEAKATYPIQAFPLIWCTLRFQVSNTSFSVFCSEEALTRALISG